MKIGEFTSAKEGLRFYYVNRCMHDYPANCVRPIFSSNELPDSDGVFYFNRDGVSNVVIKYKQLKTVYQVSPELTNVFERVDSSNLSTALSNFIKIFLRKNITILENGLYLNFKDYYTINKDFRGFVFPLSKPPEERAKGTLDSYLK